MAEQVDLSKLTDEQLGVYRDLLAQKQKPAEKTSAAPAPTVPSNKLEETISPTGGPDNFWTSPHGLIRTGLRGVVHGARELMTPGARTEGAADMIEGAGRVIAPAAIGATLPALAANPIGTIGAVAGGGLIGKGIQKGAEAATGYLGGSPSAARLAGDVAPLVGGPLLSRVAGGALKGIAPPLVKSALNLPGKAEAYGANPAAAVLDETKGFRPSTIARSGQQRLTDLSGELDTAADNATEMPSLTPARKILSRASGSQAAANSEQGPREIGRMSDQLTKIRPGFAGRAEYPMPQDSGLPAASAPYSPISFRNRMEANSWPTRSDLGPPRMIQGATPVPPVVAAEQPARNFLGMKRQFDNDFISNWSPTSNTKHGLGVARQAYGAMADELNRTVPGAERINGRMQSLIPAVDRAEAVSHNAGTMQRAMDRISRPTGALVPALIGKQMGGLPGLLAGLGVPEMISAPAVKMAFARGLYGTGKALTSPLARRTSQALPILRQSQ